MSSIAIAGAQGSLVQQDKAAHKGKESVTSAQLLVHASRKSGQSPFALGREFMRLNRGRGKLTFNEYVQYGVYSTSLTPEEKERFITNTLHWPITAKCCDMTWQATTEDKWLCTQLLEGAGITTPPILAIVDQTDRAYPGTHSISDAAGLRDFALSYNKPFFGKENRGMVSFGAFMVVAAEKDRIFLKGRGWLDYETCMGQLMGATSYVLQPVEINHGFFRHYTDALATVRVCAARSEAGLTVPFTVLKIPSKDNIADSFWRPGNLACDVDPVTGMIRKSRSRNAFGTTEHDKHPVTGSSLVGETIPHWTALLDLVSAASSIFAPLRYQSMDVAVTERGPVLIEINTGGGFDLPQLATGRGFLTDEVTDFFRSCGYKGV